MAFPYERALTSGLTPYGPIIKPKPLPGTVEVGPFLSLDPIPTRAELGGGPVQKQTVAQALAADPNHPVRQQLNSGQITPFEARNSVAQALALTPRPTAAGGPGLPGVANLGGANNTAPPTPPGPQPHFNLVNLLANPEFQRALGSIAEGLGRGQPNVATALGRAAQETATRIQSSKAVARVMAGEQLTAGDLEGLDPATQLRLAQEVTRQRERRQELGLAERSTVTQERATEANIAQGEKRLEQTDAAQKRSAEEFDIRTGFEREIQDAIEGRFTRELEQKGNIAERGFGFEQQRINIAREQLKIDQDRNAIALAKAKGEFGKMEASVRNSAQEQITAIFFPRFQASKNFPEGIDDVADLLARIRNQQTGNIDPATLQALLSPSEARKYSDLLSTYAAYINSQGLDPIQAAKYIVTDERQLTDGRYRSGDKVILAFENEKGSFFGQGLTIK